MRRFPSRCREPYEVVRFAVREIGPRSSDWPERLNLGADHVTALLAEVSHVGRTVNASAFISPRIGRLSGAEITTSLHQATKLVRARPAAAFVSATKRSLGTVQVSSIPQQPADLDGSVGTAKFIGDAKRLFGGFAIAMSPKLPSARTAFRASESRSDGPVAISTTPESPSA